MKIGLVCPYNMFRGGGVQEYVLAIQAELLKRGHDAFIVTPQPRDTNGHDPKLPKTLFLGGATDVKSPLDTTIQVSFTASQDALRELLEEHRFDILHFHEPWVPFMSRQLLTKSDSVNIATFHARLPDTLMSKAIERVVKPYTKSVLKYLNELTAVSPAAAQYVSELTDQPLNIIPNGIDLKKYKAPAKKTKKADKPTIFYVGRLEKRKGVKYLLLAFAELQARFPDTALVIGGDGPDRAKLEQLAAQLELNNVEFLGFLPEDKKKELLRSSHLFCSPALYGESFGIVLLEAMAAGLPIVAGDNPGYQGVMAQTGQISLVNPRQTREFARRLEVLLFDEAIRDAWCAWAKDYVKQFDYSKVVDQYEALYQKALRDS